MRALGQSVWRWWWGLGPVWHGLVIVPMRALILTGALLGVQALADRISPPPPAQQTAVHGRSGAVPAQLLAKR